ncbi:response regulator transcription factor [Marinibaculum pumilum]|uniref:Response regulator transcription factor n=1 Tax=Marinibaculum pumilum TaxID=1766165 RepID=A0ABV7L0G2_9PROT
MAKILVIDDDKLVLQSITAALQKSGHEVETALDGDLGMRQYQAVRPDLIVTDIIMPHKEGIGFIVELRRGDKETPIVALSGGGRSRNLEFLDMALKLGADAILRKPVRFGELIATVERCLRDGRRPAAADG